MHNEIFQSVELLLRNLLQTYSFELRADSFNGLQNKTKAIAIRANFAKEEDPHVSGIQISFVAGR